MSAAADNSTSLQNPVVSVIVPARNEEACLARCLESLVSQTGIAFEIIVVDDDSTDRTAEIARSFSKPVHGTPSGKPDPRVAVISAPSLKEHWTGKNNAMAAGAKVAKGKWLLFTDADTFHKPGSLARAVAEAEQNGAALLSYSPEQEVKTFWEKAVMPVIFAELAATYPPSQVRDPNSPIAAANGQYLMISRETYDALGGHTRIAGDLLEDVAMARMVKASGRKVLFRYAADAVRTRMYRDWPQMKEGWTKNLALLFPSVSNLACWRLTEFIFATLCVVHFLFFLGLRETSLGQTMGVVEIPWGVVWMPGVLSLPALALFFARTCRAKFSWSSTLLAFFGLPIFAYLLFLADTNEKRRTTQWKNRTYERRSPEPSSKWYLTDGGWALIVTLLWALLFMALATLLSVHAHLHHG